MYFTELLFKQCVFLLFCSQSLGYFNRHCAMYHIVPMLESMRQELQTSVPKCVKGTSKMELVHITVCVILQKGASWNSVPYLRSSLVRFD